MANLGYSKNFQGVADVFLRSPTLYTPLLQFIEQVMTGPSDLTKAEREIIAAHVSKINHCGFCLGAPRSTLAAMNVDEATLSTLENGVAMAGVSDKLRAVLTFAAKLTETPRTIGQDNIKTLQEQGWKDQAIEDAINVIALFNYVNRLVDAFGIKGNQKYFDHVGAALAAQGYAPLIQQSQKKAS